MIGVGKYLRVRVSDRIKPWPTSSGGRHRLNLILAWSWFGFGVFGLVDFLWGSLGIAKSIPILFAISVYANYVGHISAAAAEN